MDSDSSIKCPTDFFGAYVNISCMLKIQLLARALYEGLNNAADKGMV